MRSEAVIFGPPSLNLLLRIFQREKPVQVQTFIPKATVERLNMRVIRGFARPGEVQRNPVIVGSLVNDFGNKLTAIIDLNSLWQLPDTDHHPSKYSPDIVTFYRLICVDSQAFSTKIIDYS